jgi:histidyl-tRNA synthetase
MSKDNRPKARLPRGFGDRGPADLVATHKMLEAIRETYELYGFEAVETPFVEYTEALGKFLPDLDRPNEGVFSFQDDDEQWLSLRYDLTAPLARHVAENFDALPKPYRSYRFGWVFRNEKPGPGRFRQFMQFDADTVGAPGVAADAEMCMLMADTLEHLGLEGQYVVKTSNRKILDGILEGIGLIGPDSASQRLRVLRSLDKYDRVGAVGVRALLGAGRRDESGDFTAGAELDPAAINKMMELVEVFANVYQALDVIESVTKGTGAGEEGFREMDELAKLFVASGYGERVVVSPSVVRGLEYYTGPVYEAELTFPVTNEDGQTVRFGSVAGGGRYDGLVGRFRAEPVPATGFSIGVSRLLSALQHVKSPIVAGAQKPGPVVVLVMDRDRIADYQRLVARLRAENIRAEMYLGGAGMKAQMKYADRRKSPCVVIQGSVEREKGEVQVKDLVEGAKRADAIASNAEWKAERPAQVSVAEEAMVAAVREVLARHA